MGRRNKRYRLATMLRLSLTPDEQSIKAIGTIGMQREYAKPYVKKDAEAMATAAKQTDSKLIRARKLKGVTKWENGLATLKYCKTARGITQSFSSSRADERHERHVDRRKNGSRAKAKQAAREQYARVRPINEKRLSQLAEDKRVERAKREAWLLGHSLRWS